MYIPPLPHLPTEFTIAHDPSDTVFEAETAYMQGLLERFGSDRDAPDELTCTVNALKAIFANEKEFAIETDEDVDVFVDYIFLIMESALLPVEMTQKSYDAIIDQANEWLCTCDEKGISGLQHALQELHDVSTVHAGFIIANRILESVNRSQRHSPQLTIHSTSGATLH